MAESGLVAKYPATAPVSGQSTQLAVDSAGNLLVNVQAGGTASSVAINDGSNPSTKATVAQFHNSDNQLLAGTAQGLLSGGVAQLLNVAQGVDRQRGTGSDNIAAVGIATGTQQLKSRITTTTAALASAGATSVTLAATKFTNRGVNAWIQVGSVLTLEPGATNQEAVVVTAVNYGTNVVTISANGASRGLVNTHSSGVTVVTAAYNEAVDATIPDGSTPAGISAGGTYLFNTSSNSGNGGVEFERSFAGELMGATGTGAAIATEYEDTSGGPLLASGQPSGLRLLPAQSLLGTGYSSATITSTTAGNTSLTFASTAAAQVIPAGHALQLSGGASAETVFVSPTWVPGSSNVVPLASPVVNASQTTAKWSSFAVNGPGLNGFLPHGIGVEEEAVYDPVSGLYYVERSATQDAAAPQNILGESEMLWNGTAFDRARSASIGNNVAATGLGADAVYGQYNSSLPTLTSGNYSAAQLDSSGRLLVIATDNLTQVGGSNITLGSKTSANSLPVVIASDQAAVPASQSGAWTVQPGNTQNTTAWLTTQTPAASGGLSAFSSNATALTLVKGSAGQVYGYDFGNSGASAVYVQVFNAATTGAVTLGTTTPLFQSWLPAGGGRNVSFDSGIAFSSGIVVAVTTTRTGSTAPGTAADWNLFYK